MWELPTNEQETDRELEQLRIGPRLRRSRLERHLTLEQVARASGLTKGFVSQVERDMTAPSVASLVRLCAVIGISVGELFEPPSTSLVRAEEAPRINFGGTGLKETIVTPRSSSDLQVIRSEIAPGGGSGDELYALAAQTEVVHVVDGELAVSVADGKFLLSSGDTLTFRAQEPHTWRNPAKSRPCVVLWMLTPSPW